MNMLIGTGGLEACPKSRIAAAVSVGAGRDVLHDYKNN